MSGTLPLSAQKLHEYFSSAWLSRRSGKLPESGLRPRSNHRSAGKPLKPGGMVPLISLLWSLAICRRLRLAMVGGIVPPRQAFSVKSVVRLRSVNSDAWPPPVTRHRSDDECVPVQGRRMGWGRGEQAGRGR